MEFSFVESEINLPKLCFELHDNLTYFCSPYSWVAVKATQYKVYS